MVLGRSDEAAADQAAAVLGNLRGLAAKVGQLASYVDGLVPEGKRDAFEASLEVLRSQAPRSAPHEIRAAVEEELSRATSPLGCSTPILLFGARTARRRGRLRQGRSGVPAG